MDRGQSQGKRKRTEEEGTKGASTSSSIYSAATGVGSDLYDVFLSLRGPDTCKGFTDHLYHSLVEAGIVRISVFKDDESIETGEEFGPKIIDAINRSKISIPIISENYASSKWCLHELIQIMDRKKSSSHIVLPIFYKVAPSDVRHRKENFGKAFLDGEKRLDDEDIQKAKQALREVSDLNGWESSKVANGHEGELIRRVVETVQSKLQKDFQLDIPKELVGLDDRLMNIMKWIRTPSVNARMIRIYGMGGIGKTTLAKCIYNQFLGEFERASFLPDIREKATHHDGMKDLQSRLISDILGSAEKVSRIDDGINIIKSRFKGKKVIILLDDIDDKKQLDVLAREHDWFMAGSMIIVTTRNEAVLDQSEFEVDYKCEMKGLDKVQSLLLFNRHAFHIDHSPRYFESISRDIISTMDGLPLALEVVGSYLYKKTDKKVWEDLRRQLKSQTHKDVKKILRISYDALEDGHNQIFLDIACFFIGESWYDVGEYMMCMWEDCGLYPSLGIEELKLRCLIKIGDENRLEMHDQLRDLGRSIFCEGQPFEKRSGPWDDDYEGVPRVLRDDKCPRRFHELMRAALSGGKDISEVRWLQWRIDESYSSLSTANLYLPKLAVLEIEEEMHVAEDWEGQSSTPFMRGTRFHRSMQAAPSGDKDLSEVINESDSSVSTANLRLLKLAVLWLAWSKIRESWTSTLRWLRWRIDESDSSVSTANLRLPESSVPDLKRSKITEDWQGWSSLRASTQLRVLNLTRCSNLRSTPDLSDFLQLKILILHYCSELEHLHPSVGKLKHLVSLDLSSCECLKELPEEMGELKDLEELNLRASGIKEIPTSIRSLGKLKKLNASHCSSLRRIPSSIVELRDLKHLDINFSGIEELPSAIGSLANLQTLNISLTPISHLPESIGDLSYLLHLNVNYCDKLRSVPKLPSSLGHLEVHGQSLRLPQLSSLISLEGLCLNRCLLEDTCGLQLRHWELDGFRYLQELSINNCSSIATLDLFKLVHLKRLDARYCNNLGDIQGLDYLESLEDISILYCDSIRHILCVRSQNLKKINVDSCRNLVDIQGPDDGAEFLEWLSIENCKSLETLPDLTRCEKLQYLVVSGCPSLKAIPKLSRNQLGERDVIYQIL